MILTLPICIILIGGAASLHIRKGIHVRSVGDLSPDELRQIDLYLRRYGYLTDYPKGTETLATPENRADALEHFQNFNGLPETGVYDEATAQLFATPRCGCPDIEEETTDPNLPQDFLALAKWNKNILDWRVNSFPNRTITPTQVIEETRRAFQLWSNVANLQFIEQSSGAVDILIDFFAGDHNDGNPFDGPGKVLAHAFFPNVGDAHFDDDETWVSNRTGIDYFTVAAHEFGHSLGLGHSEFTDALMAPFYNGYNPNFQLHSDDIAGIQFLYGEPIGDNSSTSMTSSTNTPSATTPTTTTISTTIATITTTTTTAQPTTTAPPTTTSNPPTTTTLVTSTTTTQSVQPPRPALCSLRFNAIIKDFSGNVLAFAELNRILEISQSGQLVNDITQRSRFRRSPLKPDAAFTISSPQTVMIIKGKKLYHFDNQGTRLRVLSIRGPRRKPKKARAAIAFSVTDISIFGFDKVWKMNPSTGRIISGTYRKISEEFPGVPNGIDAAVIKNSMEILFFKRTQMFTFDRNKNKVTRVEDKGDALLPSLCNV